MSDSLWPHELQHARLPCPSLSPRICWDSCPLSPWCYLSMSCSATLVSFCFQSFPASVSFPVSWLFASGGQNIEASASVSVFPMNVQGWFPLGLTGLISLQDSRVFSGATVQRHLFFGALPFHGPTLISVNDSWKTIALTLWTFVSKVCHSFSSRSKHVLILWLQSLSSVILKPKKIKSVTGCTFPSSICHKVMEPDAIILAFWMLMRVKEESEKSVLKLKAGHSYYI